MSESTQFYFLLVPAMVTMWCVSRFSAFRIGRVLLGKEGVLYRRRGTEFRRAMRFLRVFPADGATTKELDKWNRASWGWLLVGVTAFAVVIYLLWLFEQ